MRTKKQAKPTSASSVTTSLRSEPSSHASKSLIDIDNLSVRQGNELALEGVSLCVHAGEFIGLVGPNGAGKTTLVRAMLGLLPAEKGTIHRASSMSIGYIPQRSNMYGSPVPLSVLEVVKLGARGDTAQAHEALRATDMLTAAHKRFTDLSGGQQQRVFIAKALASQPDILLLDEPTTGIDERSEAEFYDVLHGLQARGIAILMVSHDIEAALNLVTRVICLNRSVLYDGPPEHFEMDKYLPSFYKTQHRLLHHHHGGLGQKEHHA